MNRLWSGPRDVDTNFAWPLAVSGPLWSNHLRTGVSLEPTVCVQVESSAERIWPGPLTYGLQVLDFLKPGNHTRILHLYTKMNSSASRLEKLVLHKAAQSAPGSWSNICLQLHRLHRLQMQVCCGILVAFGQTSSPRGSHSWSFHLPEQGKSLREHRAAIWSC